LTEADKASHDIITRFLSGSQIPVLSEEGERVAYNERLAWKQFWLIDPLDGTKEFIKRNGEFTVNIALIRTGKPVIGVVFVPVSGYLYFASDEIGSYRIQSAESDRIEPPKLDHLILQAEKLPFTKTRNYTVVASRSHRNEDTDRFIKQLEKKYKNLSVVSRGSALKICIVAEGNADIYPRFGPTMEWDTAAGHCVAVNAGCTVIQNETGGTVTYNKENLLNPWFIVSRKKE